MCTDDDVVIRALYGSPALAEVVASMFGSGVHFGFLPYLPAPRLVGAVSHSVGAVCNCADAVENRIYRT